MRRLHEKAMAMTTVCTNESSYSGEHQSSVHHKSCFQEHKNTKCHRGLALLTRRAVVFGNCFCFADTSSIYQIVFASVNESQGQDWLEQVEPARRTGLTILQRRLAFPPPY